MGWGGVGLGWGGGCGAGRGGVGWGGMGWDGMGAWAGGVKAGLDRGRMKWVEAQVECMAPLGKGQIDGVDASGQACTVWHTLRTAPKRARSH